MYGEGCIWGPASNLLLIPDTTRHEGRWWFRPSGCIWNFEKRGRILRSRAQKIADQMREISAIAWILTLVLTAIFAAGIRLDGQTSTSFSQAKVLYVEPFEGGNPAADLRQDLIKRLKKSGKYQIVDTPQQADAVVTGKARIWVRGHFTTNSRAPAANRQMVYGSFLSVEVAGKDREP